MKCAVGQHLEGVGVNRRSTGCSRPASSLSSPSLSTRPIRSVKLECTAARQQRTHVGNKNKKATKGSIRPRAGTADVEDSKPTRVALGVDIGGSGIKGALVDLDSGDLITERHRIPTPEGASPKDVTETVRQLAEHFDWTGPIGCGFPAAVREGVVLTAANIGKEWIGCNAEALIKEATGSLSVKVVNDADAAGCAEMAFGVGKGNKGLVLMVTLGTGIGTALFKDGVLVPNTELGHIYLDNGVEGEHFASEAVRDREGLKYKEWAARVEKYLSTMEALLWPDLIIVGGGVSKKHAKWLPHVTMPQSTPILPATHRNLAGIMGAAAAAAGEV